MNKKNLNVSNKDVRFNEIYISFKKNLKLLKNKPSLVAVSGGPDSLALVALSKEYNKENSTKFYYLLVDHGIRKNSSEEALAVKKLLKKKNISLIIKKNKIKIEKNIHKNAREIRYGILKKFCSQNKIKFILTAHHSEDQIETFLIRLSRGSGVQGLSSMKTVSNLEKNIKLIRPTLDLKKKDLIYVTNKVFGKYFVDKSNFNNKFLRTKVRKLLESFEKSGIPHKQILKSIDNLKYSSETLNKYSDTIFRKNTKVRKNKIIVNYKNLFRESPEIQLNILSRVFKKCTNSYYPPRSKKIFNLIARISKNKDKKLTLSGCVIKIKKNYAEIAKEA